MRSKWVLIVAIVAAGVVAAGAVAVVGIATGGDSSSTTKAQYEATVVNVRDQVDFAFARIGKSQSAEELVRRMNDASDTVGGGARELDQTAVAKGFEDENANLVTTLRAFSDKLAATAAQLQDPTFASVLKTMSGLSFPEWDRVNAILADLKSQGIEVQPLARH